MQINVLIKFKDAYKNMPSTGMAIVMDVNIPALFHKI